MIKTIINNCFTLTEDEFTGGEVYKGKEQENNMIELENGIWLKSCGDGRYYTDNDDMKRWATVETIEFDKDGEVVQTIDFKGYIEV